MDRPCQDLKCRLQRFLEAPQSLGTVFGTAYPSSIGPVYSRTPASSSSLQSKLPQDTQQCAHYRSTTCYKSCQRHHRKTKGTQDTARRPLRQLCLRDIRPRMTTALELSLTPEVPLMGPAEAFSGWRRPQSQHHSPVSCGGCHFSRADFRPQQNTTSFCLFSQYGSLNDRAFAFPHYHTLKLTGSSLASHAKIQPQPVGMLSEDQAMLAARWPVVV